MKILFPLPKRKHHALTSSELLAVVVIIILIAIFLPTISRPGRPYKIKASVEIANLANANLANAIQAYKSEYGRYPIPTNVETAASVRSEDLTCGGSTLNSILESGASTPLNADVVAILMDLSTSPDGTPTVNSNHSLNPKQIKFLNAKFIGDTNSPGVGNDMVYRDPWGHPYVISMDLNGDDRCRDAFYKNQLVSRSSGAIGFDGLMNLSDTNGASNLFELHGHVMVWSFGPDGKADASKPANSPPNKDNVVSWQ